MTRDYEKHGDDIKVTLTDIMSQGACRVHIHVHGVDIKVTLTFTVYLFRCQKEKQTIFANIHSGITLPILHWELQLYTEYKPLS